MKYIQIKIHTKTHTLITIHSVNVTVFKIHVKLSMKLPEVLRNKKYFLST